MAEYIEREAVLEILRKQTVGTWRGVPCYPDEISRTFREVSKIPVANVAPVVRCKDCKKSSYCSFSGLYWCAGNGMLGEDFCSRGERKEG